MNTPEERPSCCFDDWATYSAKRARKRGTASPITGALLEALDAAGIEGRTLLDAGCGSGDLAVSAVAHGASRATGFDLGTGAIELAAGLARERGLADRVRFEVGDASIVPLPSSDIVVLNRVICCYPDARDLIANTLSVTGDLYAFTAPVDRGVVGWFNRLTTWVSNGWYALRRRKYRGFRVFVHDLGAVDEAVLGAGFVPVRRERHRLVWDLALYRRPG